LFKGILLHFSRINCFLLPPLPFSLLILPLQIFSAKTGKFITVSSKAFTVYHCFRKSILMSGVLSKIWGVVTLKCPNCGKEPLFSNPSLVNLKEIDKMPDVCPSCGQDFKIEVEFYYGAMFVSYAITALFMFGLMGLDILLSGYLHLWELLIYIALLLAGWSYWFRVSRSIWLAIYVWFLQPIKDK